MVYNYDGHTYSIPDDEIALLMQKLSLSKEDAIDLWLCDNGKEENEDQIALDNSAKGVVSNYVVGEKKNQAPRKTRTVKVSDEKTKLFSDIVNFLMENYNISVEIPNRQINIDFGRGFKLLLSENRVKK